MEAIILAGGLGTRLRNVVPNLPKPMAPVAGRPFLELLLRLLKSKGVTRTILSIGYMAEAVVRYFDEHPVGVDLVYEIESRPLGTGGAIVAALQRVTNDHVFVFNGDTYLDLELDMVRSMWPGDRTPIVVARQVPDGSRYGKVKCVGGRIGRFLGTGHSGPGIINAGCYLLPAELFAGTDLPESFSFEQDFLMRRVPLSVRVFVTNGQFIDIGVPSDYLRAQSTLRDSIPV